jgi:hypothetical protein
MDAAYKWDYDDQSQLVNRKTNSSLIMAHNGSGSFRYEMAQAGDEFVFCEPY